MLVGVQTYTDALEISMVILRKLGNNLPQDPEIRLFSIYTKEVHSYHKDMCSMMFIAALFVIFRTWEQLRCPSTKEWMKKM